MSADNWGKCPKCLREESLREDYEMGMWNGKFTVDYHGECITGRDEGCGYRFTYKFSVDPFTPGYLQPGRMTKEPAPPPSAEEIQQALRERALSKLTPEERAALQATSKGGET